MSCENVVVSRITMHEGQQYDYLELIKRGVPWGDAMDYAQSHPLGKSTDEELDAYCEALTRFCPLCDHPCSEHGDNGACHALDIPEVGHVNDCSCQEST